MTAKSISGSEFSLANDFQSFRMDDIAEGSVVDFALDKKSTTHDFHIDVRGRAKILNHKN